MNLTDLRKRLPVKHHEVVVDIQVMFANDMQVVLIYQGVIGQDGPCDRILNSHYPLIGGFVQKMVYYGIESHALNQFYGLVVIFYGHLMVVRPLDPLYRNALFHCFSVVIVNFTLSSIRENYIIFILSAGAHCARVYSKKKSRFSRDFSTYIVYNILQQSRPSLKKEVKIETVPEIIACHFS